MKGKGAIEKVMSLQMKVIEITYSGIEQIPIQRLNGMRADSCFRLGSVFAKSVARRGTFSVGGEETGFT